MYYCYNYEYIIIIINFYHFDLLLILQTTSLDVLGLKDKS